MAQHDNRLGRNELKVRFVELRAKGYSLAKIAQELRLAKSTLSNWSQELEAEIASARAIELEALQEQFSISKEGRIKLLGQQVQALVAELSRRDLSAVPAEKLFELLLRYHTALAQEVVATRPLSEAEMGQLKQLG